MAPTLGVALSETMLTLDEDPGIANANVGNYTVVLTGQPTGAVTVTPISGNADVTVGAALVFSTTTWNTAQSVVVTAGEDDDARDDVAHVVHTVMGIPGVSSGPRVRVAVNDDDSEGLTLAAATLASGVAEGGTETYTVQLDSEPTGPVTVAISSSDGAVTVDADSGKGGEQSTLLFNAANWDTPQEVTVRAGEDDDGESETVTLSHDPSGADYGEVSDATTSFTVADNDAKGATLSATSLVVQENGAAEYALALDTEPVGGAVSVSVASADAAKATVAPSTLTFNATNWNAPQTVTVSGTEDADTDDESVAISHAPSGADYGNSVSIGAVDATVTDDDVAGPGGGADGADGGGRRHRPLRGAAERGARGGCDGDGGRRHGEADGGRGPQRRRRPDHAHLRHDELERRADGGRGRRGGRRRRGRDRRADARGDGHQQLRLAGRVAASGRDGARGRRRDRRGGRRTRLAGRRRGRHGGVPGALVGAAGDRLGGSDGGRGRHGGADGGRRRRHARHPERALVHRNHLGRRPDGGR